MNNFGQTTQRGTVLNLIKHGAVMMAGDALENNLFAMETYIVLMDQMRNSKCVNCGNVQKENGSVATINVLVKIKFVMLTLLHLLAIAEHIRIGQFVYIVTVRMVLTNNSLCVQHGIAWLDTGNVETTDVLRWSFRVFPGCQDSYDLSEYHCLCDLGRHKGPP